MRTAVDTNVISALWSAEPSVSQLLPKLEQARADGALLLCPAVYAELLAYPGASNAFVRRFLAEAGLRVDFSLSDRVWDEAGSRFAAYAERRRQSAGEGPRRFLTDFLIGSHALVQADRLLTLDSGIYQRNFPELRLL